MIRISLNKSDARNKQIEEVLGGSRTKENFDRFKKLSVPELREHIRKTVSDGFIGGLSSVSIESLESKLKTLRRLEKEIQGIDAKYSLDTGVSVFQGIDHNFEIRNGGRFYHFSAGKNNSKTGNGDSLISIVFDDGKGPEIHALFDGTSFCSSPSKASSYAAKIFGRAGMLGLIDNGSDVIELLRGIHEHLAKEGLSTTATIALIKDDKFLVTWIGDSPALLFRKIKTGYGAWMITESENCFLGHGEFKISGQVEEKFKKDDAIILQSDGFLNYTNKITFKWFMDEFDRAINFDFMGLGAIINYPRFYYGRLNKDMNEGPRDDASVLIVKK